MTNPADRDRHRDDPVHEHFSDPLDALVFFLLTLSRDPLVQDDWIEPESEAVVVGVGWNPDHARPRPLELDVVDVDVTVELEPTMPPLFKHQRSQARDEILPHRYFTRPDSSVKSGTMNLKNASDNPFDHAVIQGQVEEANDLPRFVTRIGLNSYSLRDPDGASWNINVRPQKSDGRHGGVDIDPFLGQPVISSLAAPSFAEMLAWPYEEPRPIDEAHVSIVFDAWKKLSSDLDSPPQIAREFVRLIQEIGYTLKKIDD